MTGNIHHFVGIEIQAHNGIVALGLSRLFLNGKAIAVLVEFGHAITLGVTDPIAEHGGLGFFFGRTNGFAQQAAETRAVEDIVAQHEAGTVVADKIRPNDKGLCQTVRRRLLRIGKMHAETGSVAQQTLETGQILRR